MVLPLFAFDPVNALPYLPYAVGSGVMTALLVTVFTRRWVGRADLSVRPPAVTQPAARGTDWDANEPDIADRRGSLRRDGAPVKVFVAAAELDGRTNSGWVMDRSTGGLRLAVPGTISPGSCVQIVAENAPEGTPWTLLVVRSCKPVEDHYELGCEFEVQPPWNVLLLFG